MDRYETKRQILESAITMHQDVIDTFRNRIKDLQGGEGHINENEMDLQRQSMNDESDEFINLLANQLNVASDKMADLYTLRGDTTEYKDVRKGAIVETDKATFFICAGVEKFKMKNLQIIPLSAESPVFKKMEGKMKGDTFKYGRSDYTIKRIY